jgi:hypothetical protein
VFSNGSESKFLVVHCFLPKAKSVPLHAMKTLGGGGDEI